MGSPISKSGNTKVQSPEAKLQTLPKILRTHNLNGHSSHRPLLAPQTGFASPKAHQWGGKAKELECDSPMCVGKERSLPSEGAWFIHKETIA